MPLKLAIMQYAVNQRSSSLRKASLATTKKTKFICPDEGLRFFQQRTCRDGRWRDDTGRPAQERICCTPHVDLSHCEWASLGSRSDGNAANKGLTSSNNEKEASDL